jgi:thiol-disulfide isomerase/thioredoxin
MRRLLALLAVLALAAVLVVGLTQAGGGGTPEQDATAFDLDAAKERLQGSPAPLAALHEQSAEILDGGTDAFEERLRELRGHPVVINKWASWCLPCREEFPVFQQVATDRGKAVAFLGVNGHDAREPAREFLDERPLPFPSYRDFDEDIARAIEAPANYPITVFVDRRGETAYIHQGPYRDAAALEADIDRYLP